MCLIFLTVLCLCWEWQRSLWPLSLLQPLWWYFFFCGACVRQSLRCERGREKNVYNREWLLFLNFFDFTSDSQWYSLWFPFFFSEDSVTFLNNELFSLSLSLYDLFLRLLIYLRFLSLTPYMCWLLICSHFYVTFCIIGKKVKKFPAENINTLEWSTCELLCNHSHCDHYHFGNLCSYRHQSLCVNWEYFTLNSSVSAHLLKIILILSPL